MDEETGLPEDTDEEELHESVLKSIVRSILMRYKRKPGADTEPEHSKGDGTEA